MALDEQIFDGYLGRAMDELQTNPLALHLMRRLAAEDPEMFVSTGLKRLQEADSGPGVRALSQLLLRQEPLFERISNPQLNSKKSAIELFRRFQKVDPGLDVKLARRLPGRSAWSQPAIFDADRSARSLDILDEVSEGRRLLPILGHLTEASDPRISARATLFVGRRMQSAEWAARQLGRSDPRVRANAVESLWGLKTERAVSLFEECVEDAANRVAGNAMVGLHMAGQEDAIAEIIRMSWDESPERRITSAWAMGRLAGPEFTARLLELVKDPDTRVRGMAVRALVLIRMATPEEDKSMVETTAPEITSAPEMESETDPIREIDLRLDGTATTVKLR